MSSRLSKFPMSKEFLVTLVSLTFVVNLLLLIQPIYMLQVYDRVIPSASLDTLLYVSLMAAAAIILLGVIDSIRAMVSMRAGAKLEAELASKMFRAAMYGPRAQIGDIQPLRDLATVRGAVAGRATLALFDLPFMPIFIVLLYFIHPDLFWITFFGAILLAFVAFANQLAISAYAADAGEASLNAMASAQGFVRSSESLVAMGMVGNVVGAWGRFNAAALIAQDKSTQRNAIFAGISRSLRLGLQVGTMGYGGYLVLKGDMTSGMIFASSLVSGRALAPIDQIIGSWKSYVDAYKAWKKITTFIEANVDLPRTTDLPAPKGEITIDSLVVFPPNTQAGEPLLKRISVRFLAGECVVILGPSGAGKSTLVRALIGALQPRSGAVRIDGADVRNWNPERLGRYIGYLSQEIVLFPGTIAQNIARFDPDADDREIIMAAMKAEVHDLIQNLPRGYDTMIGPSAAQLSAGQRQRVGLARALYGSPRLLILDEPNSNLDSVGEMALQRVIIAAKEEKITVVLVSQRKAVTELADKILLLNNGVIDDFGTREEILARQNEKLAAARQMRAQVTAKLSILPGGLDGNASDGAADGNAKS